jgi:hypothetical protein
VQVLRNLSQEEARNGAQLPRDLPTPNVGEGPRHSNAADSDRTRALHRRAHVVFSVSFVNDTISNLQETNAIFRTTACLQATFAFSCTRF